MAASEVERSGTRALSGFMRAKRDTLRRGKPAVAVVLWMFLGVAGVFLVLGIKGIKNGIGKRTVVVRHCMLGP